MRRRFPCATPWASPPGTTSPSKQSWADASAASASAQSARAPEKSKSLHDHLLHRRRLVQYPDHLARRHATEPIQRRVARLRRPEPDALAPPPPAGDLKASSAVGAEARRGRRVGRSSLPPGRGRRRDRGLRWPPRSGRRWGAWPSRGRTAEDEQVRVTQERVKAGKARPPWTSCASRARSRAADARQGAAGGPERRLPGIDRSRNRRWAFLRHRRSPRPTRSTRWRIWLTLPASLSEALHQADTRRPELPSGSA